MLPELRSDSDQPAPGLKVRHDRRVKCTGSRDIGAVLCSHCKSTSTHQAIVATVVASVEVPVTAKIIGVVSCMSGTVRRAVVVVFAMSAAATTTATMTVASIVRSGIIRIFGYSRSSSSPYSVR